MNSSVKFTDDERMNKVSYNSKGGDILNVKMTKQGATWAELQNKASKNHLTQMHSNHSNKLKPAVRVGSANPATTSSDNHYLTIADTLFGKSSKQPSNNPKEVEKLMNHYRFHKGTTYSIGNDKQQKAGISAAHETFVEKQRQGDA